MVLISKVPHLIVAFCCITYVTACSDSLDEIEKTAAGHQACLNTQRFINECSAEARTLHLVKLEAKKASKDNDGVYYAEELGRERVKKLAANSPLRLVEKSLKDNRHFKFELLPENTVGLNTLCYEISELEDFIVRAFTAKQIQELKLDSLKFESLTPQFEIDYKSVLMDIATYNAVSMLKKGMKINSDIEALQGEAKLSWDKMSKFANIREAKKPIPVRLLPIFILDDLKNELEEAVNNSDDEVKTLFKHYSQPRDHLKIVGTKLDGNGGAIILAIKSYPVCLGSIDLDSPVVTEGQANQFVASCSRTLSCSIITFDSYNKAEKFFNAE